MYSDNWTKNESLHKTSPVSVKPNVNIQYWVDTAKQPIGVCVNFESANDVHYELTMENWSRFIEEVLHTDFYNHIPNFCDFLDVETPQVHFGETLKEKSIEFKKIVF